MSCHFFGVVPDGVLEEGTVAGVVDVAGVAEATGRLK
jgi:hypothetical protein